MKSFTTRNSVCRATLLAAAQFVYSASSFGATGTWTNNSASGLTWNTATSWSGGIIPNGIGDIANFTNDISANRLISLNGERTLGALNIGDSSSSFFNFTLNAGSPSNSTLIFDQTGVANASITVPDVGGVAANSIVAAYVLLKDNLAITTAFANSTTTQLAISSLIRDDAGSFGIIKSGPGIFQLAAPNTFEGGTTIQAGRINNNNLRAFGTGGVTVESGGQAFINTASSANNFTIAGTGYSNSADTAAQAGAIRLANNRVIQGNITLAGDARIGVDTTASAFIDGAISGSANLEINSPTTTTGGVTLLRSSPALTGTVSVSRGSFNFPAALGGALNVTAASGASVVLGSGTAISGNLTLDSSSGAVSVRNQGGTLAIGGNLTLTGGSEITLVSAPVPGTGTATLMTYASTNGTGSLTFNPAGYRGSPTLAVGATAATISGLQGAVRTWDNTSTNSVWDLGVSENWLGGDKKFQHADAVVFGNTAFGSVTVEGTVRPYSLTFSSDGTNDYNLSGTGTIDGASGGVIKNGSAWLTLGGENTFTGPVSVNSGRLILGSQRALGFTSGVTVASGAALDINGIAMLAVSRAYDITLSGAGNEDAPALTNNGPNLAFTGAPASGIRNITLAADATIGAGSGKNFDICGGGTLDGAGFTLTKTGGNSVVLMGLPKNLNTVIEGGILTGFSPDPFGSTLKIKAGAIAQTAATGIYSSNVTLESGATIELSTGVECIWNGTFSALGDVTFANQNTSSTNLVIAADFTIPGNLTKSGVGGGPVTLTSSVNVTGNVEVASGILAIGNGGTGGSLGSTATINMAATGSSISFNRSDNFSVPNLMTGTGGISKSGTGTLTITADNSYAGSTTILGGTLLVNGTHSGTGNTNMGAGATLGGTGTLPGQAIVPVGATLAPGTSIGALTLGSSGKTITIRGTLRIQYDAASSPAIDTLIVNDALVLDVASIIDFDPVGSPLTLPAYPIASYGSLTGTFATVTDLPAGYTLVYNYNNGVSSNNIALVKSADPYGTWIGTFFPGVTDPAIVGPTADPDRDGIANIIENQFGTNPSASNPGLVQVSSSPSSLTFQHSRADAPLAGYATAYEWSANLVDWNASGATHGGVTVNITSAVVADNPPPANDVVGVVASVSGGSTSKLFVRFKATIP
jgi:autotransporter-associated beta strand protein